MDLTRKVVGKASLSLLLFTLFSLIVSLHSYGQEVGKRLVDLDLQESTLPELFRAIERQSPYRFEYDQDAIEAEGKRVNVRVKNGDVEVILENVLRGTPFSYTREGNLFKIQGNSSKWRIIRGRVLDERGEPLPGASVRVKGSRRGAVSGTDGTFSIRTDDFKPAVLVVSFVGMVTQEINDKGDNVVRLQDDEATLDAVIVESTGYTDVDKRLSTSAIHTISADDVIEANVATLDNMLMGKVPGLTVLTDVSTPGAAAKIRVRGVSTISGSREPLWVVDGIILDDPVPLSPEEINSLDNVNLIGNAIQGINPQDIEKIDVLKDAAATALYGVRAANGVIVVTTKQGREGRMSVNYSGSFTFNQRPNYGQMDLMNSQQRIELSKEIERRRLPFAFQVSRIGYEGLLMDLYDRKLTEPEFLEKVQELEMTNTDWFGLLFRNTLSQRHNVSISGGSDKVSYYVSGAASLNPDVIKDKGVKNYNGMAKLTFRPSKKLQGMLQFRVSSSDRQYTYRGISPYAYALRTSRAIPAFDENGERLFYNIGQGFQSTLNYNFMHELDHTGDQTKINGYNVTGFLSYKPITDLTFTTTFGANFSTTSGKEWFDELSYEAAQLRKLNYGVPFPEQDTFREQQSQLPYGGMLRSNNVRNTSWQWRAQVIYNWRPWEGHVLSINAGPEFRSTRYQGLLSTEFGYLPDRGESFMYIDPAVWKAHKEYAKNYRDRVTNRISNFVSLFANLTYSYQNRYIFTYNVRAEGSNKFGQDRRARFLPIWSLSGRWNIHQEHFLKDMMWLNMLALRGSYGIQGNVSDEQTPQMIMRYGEYNEVAGFFQSRISKLPNPLLRWEKNRSFNLGFETALLDNRLTLSVDYYERIGTDQLINKAVSHSLGRNNIQINAGTLVNKGIDFMVGIVPIRNKDWTWTLNLNGARSRNKVTDGGVNTEYTYFQYLNGTAIVNGNPIDAFYSYRFKGLTEQGYPDFYGIEESGEEDTKEEFFAKVMEKSGDRVPFAQGGLSTSLRYKDFTLSLFFSYSVGNKVRLNDLYANTGQKTPQPYQNLSAELVDRWQKPGDEAHTNIPVLTADPLDDVRQGKSFFGPKKEIEYAHDFAANRWQMYNKSNLRVVDGSHIRLRTVTLTYRVPQDFLRRTGISSAMLRLNAYNLFVLSSKDLRGQDPSQMTLGSRTTPPLPSYAFTIDLSF